MTTPTTSTIETYLSSPAITQTHSSTLRCSSPVCTATTDTRTISTLCGHVFHPYCLTRLLGRSDRCAHCQTRLWTVPRVNRTLLLRPRSRSPSSSPPIQALSTSTTRAPSRRSESRKEIQRQKAAKATNALIKSCENLNNVSKGLHLVADTMQRATRDMQACTREV
jgi:hypothetical protein